VTQDVDRWQAVVNAVMNLRIPANVCSLWVSLVAISFSRKVALLFVKQQNKRRRKKSRNESWKGKERSVNGTAFRRLYVLEKFLMDLVCACFRSSSHCSPRGTVFAKCC
jgi:hypothetical protein